MAVTALGTDTVLPAFPEIREAFDLDAEATSVTSGAWRWAVSRDPQAAD